MMDFERYQGKNEVLKFMAVNCTCTVHREIILVRVGEVEQIF